MLTQTPPTTTQPAPPRQPHVTWGVAACARDSDPDAWFADDQHRRAYAQQTCNTCPIRLPCLLSALTHGETWGIWGGFDLEQASYTDPVFNIQGAA